MKKIAIIPARIGSKRIHRKNIKNFLGKPIIAYTIIAAKESNLFDEIIVSTDDISIADIAENYGAKVPFLRSKKNSDDYASTYDVLIEVLNKYGGEKSKFEFGCCLYPAAPLISIEMILKCYNKIINGNWDTTFPIVEYGHPIDRALIIDNSKRVRFINPSNSLKRTQDIGKKFHDSGQFYWFNIKKLFENKELISKNSSGIIVSKNKVQDIDNLEDWKLAEIKYKLKF